MGRYRSKSVGGIRTLVGLRSKLSSGLLPLQISWRHSYVGGTAIEALEWVATASNQCRHSYVGGTALEALE